MNGERLVAKLERQGDRCVARYDPETAGLIEERTGNLAVDEVDSSGRHLRERESSIKHGNLLARIGLWDGRLVELELGAVYGHAVHLYRPARESGDILDLSRSTEELRLV